MITEDMQKLAPGNWIELWIVDAAAIGGGQLYFQAFDDATIIWQGQEYSPWPLEATDFARTSDQQPTPRLRVGNIDASISVLCQAMEDMVGAKVTRIRTMKKYLDEANFPEGNPDADPTQHFPEEVWFIGRKSSESDDVVEFELASALNFQGVQLPRRQIIANQCSFQYRGPYCNYVGPPVADVFDQPTSDPAFDRCGKRLRSCKLREWPDNILNYGGFPAAGLVRV